MDVRCEKCQTEYELDESRLKPGGVTVKCTHCGHLFKIRDGAADHAAPPAVLSEPPNPLPSDADSMLAPPTSTPAAERLWLIRLENGEQRTCRELSTLQDWIATGVAGREAMISRSGKTWKRLGGIVELNPYFAVAEEAKARAAQPVAATSAKTATLRGVAGPPVSGDEPGGKSLNPLAQTELSLEATQRAAPSPTGQPGPPATATWTAGGVKGSDSMAAMPQGPRSGRIALQDREPAFANRARIEPGRMPQFDDDDDDDFLPSVRGSRAGMWIALAAMLAIAGAAAVYLLRFRGQEEVAVAPAKDAAVAPVAPPDAAVSSDARSDAQATQVPDPLASVRTDLITGVETRMKTAYDSLSGKEDAPSLAMRARLGTGMAQAAFDRADLAADRAESDKLRKDAKQLVISAAALAERSRQLAADDPSASLAIADVLRLQAKPASDVQRYLDAATSKSADNADLKRSIALCGARLMMRDGKLDEAQKMLAALDRADDHRIGLALALIAYGQNKPEDAKPLLATVVEASPGHPVATAVQKRLESMVVNTDPLPPEGAGSMKRPTGGGAAAGGATGSSGTTGGGAAVAGGDYDTLVARAKNLATTNCAKAMELYTKALEQTVTGVEALTGMGYCFLNAKQYASAFSKFRSALAVSNRYEPALAGVAETYQQQGNREQEIEAWRKYIESFPNSPKAKRRLEALGAAGPAGGGSTAGGTGVGAGEPGNTSDTPQQPTPSPPPSTPPTGGNPESPNPP